MTDTPPVPTPPASPNDGMTAQTVRVLGLAAGGFLVDRFLTSDLARAAALPAFGVLAIWLYGLWERRKSNKDKITMHSLLSSLSGGLIR